MPSKTRVETPEESKALAVRWPCGCIPVVDAAPEHMTAKDKKLLAGYVVDEGAEIIRGTVDEIRAMPFFLPVECPHEPKGWTRDHA